MKALSLLLLIAFGGPASAAGGSANEHVSQGVYWVPVPQELSEFAVFAVKDIKVKEFTDKVKIEYDLPAELTGPVNKIELEGLITQSGPVTLKGAKGMAECPSATDLSACKIFYHGLDINPSVRTELLKSIVKTPDELELRERVAASFCAAAAGGEPCGFLKVLKGD